MMACSLSVWSRKGVGLELKPWKGRKMEEASENSGCLFVSRGTDLFWEWTDENTANRGEGKRAREI
jgi:hypothetical protein